MCQKEKIRFPAVAEQFYYSDPTLLREQIQYFRKKVDVKAAVNPVQALILPHAGYVYSCETAVRAVARAQNSEFRRIVVMAPSHRIPFSGIALCDYTAYRTPLGDISLDAEAIAELSASGSSEISLLNEAHSHEHALEVELPILQEFFQDFKLLPFICGQIDIDTARILAGILEKYWTPDTLWVVSSDFTHYGASFGYVPFRENVAENLKKLDLGAVEKLTSLDLEGFDRYLSETGATICGANPIKILLALINKINRKETEKIKAELVDYTTSGEISGDYSHCVSYASLVFTR